MSLLIALLMAANAAEPAASRHVTLPLDEYERLRKLDERPSLTVVDLLRVEGSFVARDLAVTLTGRAAGTWPTAEVLTADGVRVHSCEGDALVSRDEAGAFTLTPLASRFRVRCRLALDGSDRLEAHTTRAVLEVDAAVRDGELVASAGEDGGRVFSVVRAIAGARDDLPPSVAGRYQLTLLPEETRFLYRLDVRNPSRGHRRFAVALREAEHVESVDARVAWDTDRGTYRFDLPPGETTLTLRGRLTGASFIAPVTASLQYLLVDAHPLIRPEVRTAAKRVGVGETGLSPEYRGAQAFLLDGAAEVAWTATRLEALKTAGLALNGLEQVFFLGADGKARGEASFTIDNQGAPALALPATGEPTFASVGGEPAFLTRDADGRLFLPLAQGAQSVVVQDVRPFRHALGFALARLELPRAGVPASRAEVQLRYPAEWIPLYEELAPASRLHLLDAGEVALVLLLLAAAERLLALGGVPQRRRWVLAGALALVGALSESARLLALGLVLAPLLALGAAMLVRRLAGAARVVALAGGAIALLIAFGMLGASNLASRLDSGELGSGPMNDLARQEKAAPAELESRANSPAAGLVGGAAGYVGLPARIDLPAGARRTTFTRELLATDAPRPVFVVLASARFVAALTAAAVLLALALAFVLRRDLRAGIARFAARFRTEDAAALPAT